MGLTKHQRIICGFIVAILLGLILFAIWVPENKTNYPVWENSGSYPIIVQFPNGTFGIKVNQSDYRDLNSRFFWEKGTPFFYECQGSKRKVFTVWEKMYAEVPNESKIFKE